MIFVMELQKDFRTGDIEIDQRNLAELFAFIKDFYDGIITPRNLQLAYSACHPYMEKLPPAPPPPPPSVDKRRGIIKSGATRRLGDPVEVAAIRQQVKSPEDLQTFRKAVNAALAQRRGASAAGKADRSIGSTGVTSDKFVGENAHLCQQRLMTVLEQVRMRFCAGALLS